MSGLITWNNRNVDIKSIGVGFKSASQVMFYLLIITIPFRFRIVINHRPSVPIYRDYVDFLIFLPDLFLFLTLVFWIVSILLLHEKIKIQPRFLSFPLIALLLISFLGLSSSVDTALSSYHLIRMISMFLFFLYLVTESLLIDKILNAISIQIIIQSIVGIAQVLSQKSLELTSLGELDLDPAISGVSVVSADGIRFLRLYGLSDHPNIIGGSIAFGLVLLCGWIILSDGWKSYWALIAFTLGVPALFLTFSRSSWVAFIIGMAFILMMLNKHGDKLAKQRIMGLILAGILISAPFILSYSTYLGVRLNIEDSFTQISLESRSINERKELNKAAVEIFTASPIIGSGLGTFPVALQNKYPKAPYNFQPPHFVLLEVAAELGLIGALFYFVILIAPWIILWINVKSKNVHHQLIIISAVLLSISVIGFLDYYTWLLVPGRLWQWLIWGFWGNIYNNMSSVGNHG